MSNLSARLDLLVCWSLLKKKKELMCKVTIRSLHNNISSYLIRANYLSMLPRIFCLLLTAGLRTLLPLSSHTEFFYTASVNTIGSYF